ncbi:hypothetical protein V6O07_17135, partial [Arthrospira platensis SPKY2]
MIGYARIYCDQQINRGSRSMGRMIWIILLALLFLTACGEEEATPTPIPPPAETAPALVSPEPPILTVP